MGTPMWRFTARRQLVIFSGAVALGWLGGCAGGQGESEPTACDPGFVRRDAGCAPADRLLLPHVQALQVSDLELGSAGGGQMMALHPAQVRVSVDLTAPPLRATLAVHLGSAARDKHCVAALLSIDHAQAGRQTYDMNQSVVVPGECEGLVGAADLVAWPEFDATRASYLPARDDQGAPLPRRAATCGHSAPGTGACVATQLLPSAGVDVALQPLRLASSVATLQEDAGPAVARGSGAERDDRPLLTMESGASVVGVDPRLTSTWQSGDLALSLEIRPKGTGAWTAVEHAMVDVDQAGLPVSAASVAIASLSTKGSTALKLRIAATETLRDRLLRGDWKDARRFEVRACANTSAQEGGPDADAKANNCQISSFVVVRHAPPPVDGTPSAMSPVRSGPLAAYDYLEFTLPWPFGFSVLEVANYRGPFREIDNGHFRLGGMYHSQVESSIFTVPKEHLVEAAVYHDTAPAEQDFVTGYIKVVFLPVIDLPKLNVPEKFYFALAATADTKGSKGDFGAKADLGPLTSALNLVGQPVGMGDFSFCVFGVACLGGKFSGGLSLQVGLAFSKTTTQPSCVAVPGVGCYAVLDKPAMDFNSNKTACKNMGVQMASDHQSTNVSKVLRAVANQLAKPFYLAMFRPGLDYAYYKTKELMDAGWTVKGSEYASLLPTHWAFLDPLMEPENGACAAQAPDSYAKSMKVDYGQLTVAKAAATNPAIYDQASRAHVGCEAKLTPVCELPVNEAGKVMYENSEIYLQFNGKIGLTQQVTAAVDLLIIKGSATMSGSLATASFAAGAGILWSAIYQPVKGYWRVKGENTAKISVNGSFGAFDVSGEGCAFIGIPGTDLGAWKCLTFKLGDFITLPVIKEAGVGLSLSILPFDFGK